MRRLKFCLDRRALETIYLSFIRPSLEYADVLWCNAAKADYAKLDKVQNECARIVTGATRLVSLERLKQECKWESLHDRRHKHRITHFYKMYHNLVPDYLSSLVPRQQNTRYHLRNENNIPGINSRTTLYFNSFLPTSIREWNALPQETRNIQPLSAFKIHLNRDLSKPPLYYFVGPRRLQLLHTRLRTKCSSLNYHLYLCNISQSALCA